MNIELSLTMVDFCIFIRSPVYLLEDVAISSIDYSIQKLGDSQLVKLWRHEQNCMVFFRALTMSFI